MQILSRPATQFTLAGVAPRAERNGRRRGLSKCRPGVVLVGDLDDMRLAERPLEEVIDWCAQSCVWYGAAADWRPWERAPGTA